MAAAKKAVSFGSWGGSAIAIENAEENPSDEALIKLIHDSSPIVLPQSNKDDDSYYEESESDDDQILTGTELTHAMKAAQREASVLRRRLLSRTAVIAEIRKAYLSDIICMKNVLMTLKKPDLEEILHLWQDTVPSLDLKQSLEMHKPELSHLNVTPCKRCGGQVDIVFHNSQLVDTLNSKMSSLQEKYHDVQQSTLEKESLLFKRGADAEEALLTHETEVCCWAEYTTFKSTVFNYYGVIINRNTIYTKKLKIIKPKWRR